MFSCMRPHPRKIKSLDLRPNRVAFDAIIVWKGKGDSECCILCYYLFSENGRYLVFVGEFNKKKCQSPNMASSISFWRLLEKMVSLTAM
jgi:hypothetical protein